MPININSWLKELLGEDVFQGSISSNSSVAEYFVVPNNQNPKLLFPKNLNKKGLLNSFDLYPVLTPKHFLKKSMISTMYRFRFLLPTSFSLSIGNRDVAKRVYQKISDCQKNYSKVAFCSMRTGSAGKGKKLIFQFLDAHGNILSYIKLGDASYRGKWLDNECATLEYLKETCKNLIVFPDVIGYKKSSSYVALELSPLRNFHYYPQQSYQYLADILSQLVMRTKSEPLYEFDNQEDLLRKYIKNSQLAEVIINHLEYAKNTLKVWSIAHRDMPAWNVLSNDKGEIAILDWEFARKGHNPFQDMFHYKIHTHIHNSGKTPEKIIMSLFRDKSTKTTIAWFGCKIGVTDPHTIFSLFILYLWDWYKLERDNAQTEEQGQQYLHILKYLGSNENSYKYFI
ncbi:MAG: hypothetical protein HQ534_07665 [Armatimonadetes bacterium]|nr:hypothetical protein [Armatimonadota bacterium]